MIIFIHLPGFYAAVEQADDPALRGLPVAVGGDPQKRGSITSASREARREGVVEGMESGEASQRCPGLRRRPTRMKRYREVAAEIRDLLRAASDRIEEVGLDGTFVQPDVPDPVAVAAEMCVRIQAEIGVRAVAGVAETRFAAYLAAKHAGPGGIYAVPAAETRAFIGRFDVSEVWGLGPATAARLADKGIVQIGALRDMPGEELETIAGRTAPTLQALARADPDGPLRPKPRAKSLSQERTLPEPTVDLRSLSEELGELARHLDAILARERRAARTVTLEVFFVDGTRASRSQTQAGSVGGADRIADVALQLLARTQAGVRRVRRIRLKLSNLGRSEGEPDPRQLRLF